MPSLLPVFTLRISEQLLDDIKLLAEKNCRSTNKEIEYALTQYVKQCKDNNKE